MEHFRHSSASGSTIHLDAKSADQLAAARDMGVAPKLNPAEAASLSRLELQIAESKLTQLHNHKHGNAQAQEKKSKAAAMVQSMHIHGGGK